MIWRHPQRLNQVSSLCKHNLSRLYGVLRTFAQAWPVPTLGQMRPPLPKLRVTAFGLIKGTRDHGHQQMPADASWQW